MLETKKVGKQTIRFANPPVILETSSIVGPKEGEGPLKDTFDYIVDDMYFGEKSWERAERKFLEEAVKIVLNKKKLTSQDIDFLLAGDLLNQIISSNFAASTLGIPFLGLYGACSTMYEAIALAAVLIDGGFAGKVIAATSSHYATSERQFRYPTEQAVQRPLTAQWTVTGAGAMLLGTRDQGEGPVVTFATVGKAVDAGAKDPMNMGAAMAPAAVDTIITHLQDTGRKAEDYDLIITGDLGSVGRSIAIELANKNGYDLSKNLNDCGILIFDPSQDTHAGGSGCACSAVVTCGFIMKALREKRYKRILGIGTGALMSVTSIQQQESIPAIGHAVAIENV